MSRQTSGRAEDRRTLPVGGCTVTQCRLDYRLSLLLDGPGGFSELVIEGNFTLSLHGGPPIALSPGGHPRDLAPALEVFGLVIDRATTGGDGTLEVVLDGDTILRAGPGDLYEAWSLVLP